MLIENGYRGHELSLAYNEYDNLSVPRNPYYYRYDEQCDREFGYDRLCFVVVLASSDLVPGFESD